LLRELHPGVQEADDAILDDANNGHRTPTRTKMLLERARSIAGHGIWNRQLRLCSKLLIQGLAFIAPSVGLWCWHDNSL
jgi:hypothetical protein